MKRIASSYVYYYNHKYDRVGHLFQVRFRSQRQLSFIGKNTLDIYILHYFLISSINLTMVGQWFNDTNNGLMATVLAIIIAVHVTYIAIYAGKFLRKSKFLNDFAFGNIFRKK